MDEEGHLVHVEFETIQGSSDEDEDAKVRIVCFTGKVNIDSFVWHRIKERDPGFDLPVFNSVVDPWHFGKDPVPRIRVTNVPYGSRSFSFRQWQDATKNKFFVLSYCLLPVLFEGNLHHSSEIKS